MILDLGINIIIVFSGFYLCKYFNFNKNNLQYARLLWIYHLCFSIFFYYYILGQGGSDSTLYWEDAKLIENFDDFLELLSHNGTRAMIAINYLPSNVLELSYFTGCIMYALLGHVAILIYYKVAIDIIPYKSRFLGIPLFPALFFLPNLHFWTCNVGKDTVSFFTIAAILYGFQKLRSRWFLVVSSIVLGYLIRPHIILFVGVAFSLAYLIKSNTKAYFKLLIFVFFAASAIVLLPIVAEYAKIEEISVDGYEEFASRGVSNLSRDRTTSSVDVNSYSLPVKILTFLYRPTFIDIFSIPALIAALENFFLLILSLFVIRRSPLKTFKAAPFILQVALILLVIGTLLFSMSLGNLGIMLRMRNMFLPALLLFILWSFSFYTERKYILTN